MTNETLTSHATYEKGKMTPEYLPHLSADDLDAIHLRNASGDRLAHVANCDECRKLVVRDRALISMLEALPTWEPTTEFAANVLAAITATAAATKSALPAIPDRVAAARRRLLIGGVAVAGLLVAAFTWAVLNPASAARLASPTIADLGHSLWISVQALAANTVEQPWFDSLRDTLASPTRAVPLLLAAGSGYVVALAGFRRVLTRSATDASW